MKQYNYHSTGADFCIIDYGKNMGCGHSINVVYTDGVNFIHSQGWADTMGEAVELMERRAEMFGVQITGRERVA